jgi:uncharacterized protein YbjT (DUF2867 family)
VQAKRLKVLVAGATGRQGGAVAHWLLAGGHQVVAQARNLAHPEGLRLMRRGARLAWSSFDDRDGLADAMHGCDALFLVTTAAAGTEAETRQGILMVDVAREAGVAHVLLSSAPAAASPTGIPHFDSKHAIERHLAEHDVPHTVIAPAFFMENFLTPPFLEQFRAGQLTLPYPAHRKLQQISVSDIGRFAVVVFEQPGEYLTKRIAIASDELTGIEMAATLARVVGRSIVYEEQPLAKAWATAAVQAATFEYLQRTEGPADVLDLRQRYDIGWHTLDGWAKQQDWLALLDAHTSLRSG